MEHNATRSALVDALLNSPRTGLPGVDVTYGGEISPMITGLRANQGSLNQRRPSVLPIPSRPPRPFSEDYPPSYFSPWLNLWRAPTDPDGKLRYDPEGRKLVADNVVGRQYKDGPDVPLTAQKMDDVIAKVVGSPPSYLSEALMRDETDKGPPPVGRIRPSGPNWPGSVEIDVGLRPDERYITAGHELGHAIGGYGTFITKEIADELRSLYNTINNRDRTPDGRAAAPGRIVTPRDFRYAEPRDIQAEYIAEAFRAYMADPNFMKSEAPKTAAAIRRFVNSNPRFNRAIQFNSLKFPTFAGLGQSPDQAQGGIA